MISSNFHIPPLINEFLGLMARYILAILSAFVVSITVLLLITFPFAIEPINSLLQNNETATRAVIRVSTILMGASGVFVATFITPRSSRAYTGWFFTVLGCAFYLYYWLTTVVPVAIRRNQVIPPPHMLLWLFIGGVIISIYFTIKQNKGPTKPLDRSSQAQSGQG
jgi:hypothetical protein